VGEAHRRTTNIINALGRWAGHLFQSRFSSVAMHESHLIAAARYVSLNPLRARLARKADDWTWSSVRAHLARDDDELVSVAPALNRVDPFAALLEIRF
jgi:putative transposase